jgi:hypothetical protein|tara:strand:+ start:849 stop:1373 length:525 start_codon:yes stop_codon:yes gene_type:complete
MAFKMKYSPDKKSGAGFPYKGKPLKYDWLNKLKTKASNVISDFRDKTVNMSNIVGDPEFKAKMVASHKRDKKRASEQKIRHAYQNQKREKINTLKQEYLKGPESKQRPNESDKQYNRRYNDSARHAQNYAEKKYQEQKKKKIAQMTPKTKEQTQLAQNNKNKKSLVFTKKKYKS